MMVELPSCASDLAERLECADLSALSTAETSLRTPYADAKCRYLPAVHGPHACAQRKEALHEPYWQLIGNQGFAENRFMASIRVQILEVFPLHEPEPSLSSSFSNSSSIGRLSFEDEREDEDDQVHGPDAWPKGKGGFP